MTRIRLGDVCEKIGSGATPRGGTEVYLPEGTALIRSQNVHNEGFRKEGLAFIDEAHAAELQNVEVKASDVLLNITGDSVARVCQVPSDILPARVNQHVAIIRPEEGRLHARYLRYFLVSPAMQARMLALAGAGATRNALTKGMIEQFEIPAPPLPEQRAIAEILGALDDKIELNRRMNETLEAMARAIFKSWFVDFEPVRAKMEGRWRRGQSLPGLPADLYDLFPDSFEDSPLGKVPKGWRVVPFGKVAEIFDSKRVPLSSRERANRRGPFPYFGAAGILDHIDDYLFDGTFVLLGEDGSVVKPDGRPFVQYVWGKFWVNNHAHVLAGKGGVSSEHLALFLKDVNIAPYVTGAVQPKLNQANMCSILFLLPSDVVCRLFAYVVRPLYDAVKVNVEQSELLAALRDALLPKLISGEIRIGDATAVVSEAV